MLVPKSSKYKTISYHQIDSINRWSNRHWWVAHERFKQVLMYVYIHFRSNHLIYLKIFATDHGLMNYTHLIDSCQAHFPVQYASNIELIRQKWYWCCDWQWATPESLLQNKVSKGAKIRNPYNQVPRLTQYTNGKVTNLQLDTTNESQEVSPFP